MLNNESAANDYVQIKVTYIGYRQIIEMKERKRYKHQISREQ